MRELKIFIALFVSVFVIDQYIKYIFVDGYVWHSECISLILAYNKGVAFSMFAFLAEYLKYIQLLLLAGVAIFLYIKKEYFYSYYHGASLILAGGLSNVLDRFFHEGVVDYIYWHCYFDFAIFNFADVMIDLGVVIVLYISYQEDKKAKEEQI
jgi:signal peptidase II